MKTLLLPDYLDKVLHPPDLPAPADGDGHQGPVVAVRLGRLDVGDDPHPLDHAPEHHVLAVQVRAVHCNTDTCQVTCPAQHVASHLTRGDEEL